MAELIGAALRREVASRAQYRCEYCLMPEAYLLAGCEVDHVISRKHGGLQIKVYPAGEDRPPEF
ncbi:MAG: HNH endonuclease signature motif containing protein [Opitutaceae bacterium]|nr:HNH endonuclease signature motif containing protein [Opitutaceae bacterium]